MSSLSLYCFDALALVLCNGFHQVKKKYLSLHRASLKARQNRRYGENDRERLAKIASALVEKVLFKQL